MIIFQQQIKQYEQEAEQLLPFYNTFGCLVDFEMCGGYSDYDKLKRQIQFNLKH